VPIPATHDRVDGPDGDNRIVQGSDNEWSLSFESDFGMDWSGYAARCEFRGGVRDEFPDVLARATATIIDPGPATRIIQFKMDNATSDALSGTDGGLWDAEIYNGLVVYRVVQGKWSLNRGVTE
jgi:hypothetical protein